jgi:hypothetical protein
MKKNIQNISKGENISFLTQRNYFGEKKSLSKLFEQGGFGGVGTSPEQVKKMEDKITQSELEKTRQNNLKSSFDERFEIYDIPYPNSHDNDKTIILPIKSRVSFFEGVEDLRKVFFKGWEGTQYANQIPKDFQLPKVQPGTLRTFVTPDEKWYKLTLVRNEDGYWKFDWFFDENNQPFIQQNYFDEELPKIYLKEEETWWDLWSGWTLTLLSIAAAALIPGMQGLLLSAAIDLVVAGNALVEGDGLGAIISTLLAFAPFLSYSVKGLGRFSSQEVKAVSSKFARAETEAEVKAIYKRLSDKEKILVRGVMSQEPKQFLKLLDENIWKVYEEGLKRGTWNAKDVVNSVNKLISEKKLPMPELAKWWQKNPNLTRFGIDLGTTGLILAGSTPFVLKQELEKTLSKTKEMISTGEKRSLTPEELKNLKNNFWEENNE